MIHRGGAAASRFWHTHRFLISFVALSLLMGISVGLAKVTTTLYALHLDMQGWTLGALAAAQSAGLLVMSVPVGFWVERLGPGKLFMLGSGTIGLAYAVLPQVPHAAFLSGMTLLISFLIPLRFVSLNTVFMTALERMGESRAGWFRATHMSGMLLIGPVAGAAVVHAHGHTGSYGLIATLFLITLVLSPWVFTQHEPAPTALGEAKRPHHTEAGMLAQLRALLKVPGTQRLVAQEAAIQAVNSYHAFYIVVIAVNQLGLPAASAGTLVAVQGGAFVGAMFLLGNTVKRMGHRAVPVSAALTALATAQLATAHSATGLGFGGALLGIGLGMLEVQTLTQFARLGAQVGRGRVAGLTALAGPGGGLLGGLVGGTLGVWLGLQPAFWVFLPVFAVLGRTSHPHKTSIKHSKLLN